MEEIWKPIKGYEGFYEASSLGKIRSLDRIAYNSGIRKQCHIKGRILSLCAANNGYVVVNLCKKTVLVHRAVYSAFYGEIPKGMDINHKNGNRHDNKMGNLEICTRSENIRHSFDVLGRKPTSMPNAAKPVYQIKNGIIVGEYSSAREAEKRTGISYKYISKSCHSKFKAGGYKWAFKTKTAIKAPFLCEK